MLELAILGLLKEQPLHGYELKKRLGETLGSLWGISYGSLYPALRRLERDGSIEIVEPDTVTAPMPATGSLDGDLAAARLRRPVKASRRTRKAYRLTERGDARLSQLLLDDDTAGDDERARLCARDGTGVVCHVVDGDVQRVVVPEHDHRHRVTHQDQVDPGGVDRTRGRCVVRGDHHQRWTGTFAGDDVGRAERAWSLTRVGHLVCPPPSRARSAPGGRRNHSQCSTPLHRSALRARLRFVSCPTARTVPRPTVTVRPARARHRGVDRGARAG